MPTGNAFFGERDRLTVTHGFEEEPIEKIDVPNHHDIASLIEAADSAVPEPVSWIELIDYCRDRFVRLSIGEHCRRTLSPQPFSPNVARRTIELLKALDEISAERDERGALSPRGEGLKRMFFVGRKAWFTDEGADNKVNFGSDMTFPDPHEAGRQLQCFWHGKIKTPQFRIHFDSPNPPPARPIRVAYIGPKISKH